MCTISCRIYIESGDTNNNQGPYSASATFQINAGLLADVNTILSIGSLSGEGAFISHGMVQGSKYLSYYDPSTQDVKYRLCSNTTCTTGSTQTIDATGDVGQFLAVTKNDVGGDDGLNHVYYDATNGDLKIRSCFDQATCANVVVGVGDTTDNVGKYASIVIVNTSEMPKVAYYDETNGNLKYLSCNGEQCDTSSVVTLDSTGDVGKYTSIASLKDGTGTYISYYDVTNGNLKFVRCATENCSSPVISTIDSTGDVGQFTSIDMGGDGLPHIVYYDVTNGNLKLANCNNATCTAPTIITLASSGDVGKYANIRKDPIDGFMRIAYYDETNGDLRYIRCTNAACTTRNSTIIDSAGDVGKYVSMDVDSFFVSPTTYNTYPSFAYFDDTNDTLKFVKCYNDDCNPPINTAPTPELPLCTSDVFPSPGHHETNPEGGATQLNPAAIKYAASMPFPEYGPIFPSVSQNLIRQ